MRLRRLERWTDPLWIPGMIAAVVLAARELLRSQSGTDLWIELVLLGTLLPALLLAMAWILRSSGSRARPAAALLLSTLAAAVCLPMILGAGAPFILLAVLHLMVAQALHLRSHRWDSTKIPGRARLRRQLHALPANLLVALISWAAAAQLLWWTPERGTVIHDAHSAAVLLGLLVIVVVCVHDARPAHQATAERWGSLHTAAALPVIALASLRVDDILGRDGFHHWSFYIGPAELVRQGHWLLWDIPSQYGFLSTLAIAAFPAGSTWQSLFLLNALLNLTAATVLFLALRSIGRGRVNLVLSLVVTIAAQLLRYAGPRFEGPPQFPSTGGLRFVWAMLLMSILLRLRRMDGDDRRRSWYIAGCVIWLIGVAWSPESAIYCTVIWLPACVLLHDREARGSPRLKALIGAAVRALLLPATLLGGTVVLIVVCYAVRLGHGPDWAGFIEYGRSYQAGDAYTTGESPRLVLDPGGAVWILLVVFAALSVAGVRMLHRAPPVRAALWGAWAGTWSTASYFVSRPHPNNVANLAPILAMSIAMALNVMRDVRPWGLWPHRVRIASAALLTMFPASMLSLGTPARDYAAGLVRLHAGRTNVARLLPRLPGGAQDLLTAARIRSGDPIAFAGCDSSVPMMPLWRGADGIDVPAPRAWTALSPAMDLDALPPARRRTYLSRFAAASPSGGWLLECTPAPPFLAWVDDEVGRLYRAGPPHQQGPWRLTHYALKVGGRSTPAG